jgi:hypothetical protein
VGIYSCLRGCGCKRTSEIAPGFKDFRVTVYITPDGAEHFQAPACEGDQSGKNAKEQSAS